MIEIAFPIHTAIINDVPVRFFAPARGATDAAWCCMEDLYRVALVPSDYTKACVASLKQDHPDDWRDVRMGGERLTFCNFRMTTENIAILGYSLDLDQKVSNAMMLGICAATELVVGHTARKLGRDVDEVRIEVGEAIDRQPGQVFDGHPLPPRDTREVS